MSRQKAITAFFCEKYGDHVQHNQCTSSGSENSTENVILGLPVLRPLKGCGVAYGHYPRKIESYYKASKFFAVMLREWMLVHENSV